MVTSYGSRKVVEDYVLYKIKQHVDLTNRTNSASQLRNGSAEDNLRHFPLPQDPPSEINSALRKVARDYEERYKEAYPDLLDGIRANHIASCSVDKVFSKITNDLFRIRGSGGDGRHSEASSPSGSRKAKISTTVSDPASAENRNEMLDASHVKWGHVIGLLVFTGILAVRCVEINDNERVDQIVSWVSKFLDTRLGPWLKQHGGWSGFMEWYEGSGATVDSWFDQYQIGQGMRRALKVGGAVAALALGAAMLTRK